MSNDKKYNKLKNSKKNGGKEKLKPPPGKSLWQNVLVTLLIFFIIIGAYSLIEENRAKEEKIAISQLAAEISAGTVSEIVVSGEDIDILYTDGTKKKSRKETGTALTNTLVNYGVSLEELKDVKIEIKNPSGFLFWLGNLAPFLIPLLFIVFFIWFLSRQVKGVGMQAFSFGQSKARMIDPKDKTQRVTFDDIAGAKEAKEELLEIVDFLKNPKKFLDIGARIPKGIVLMGAPGTGKTLLARAVAGEASVPFFSISGSEFVEMFVGVGASVTGDTPVLIRTKDGTKLLPISEVVDSYYKNKESNRVKYVNGIETLGFKNLNSGFRGENSDNKTFFGGSKWSSVRGVLRHKADKIYKIQYRGGEIKTTGDHSIFVRDKNMITVKKACELERGDILVNLPFKVRSKFIPDIGTTHKIRAHDFSNEKELYLELYKEKYQRQMSHYNFAIENRDNMYQGEIGRMIGVSQSTVKNWQLGYHKPMFFSSTVVEAGMPQKIKVTEDLMRLLGYYTAEGRTDRYYTQFVFGSHEKALHNDCIGLIKDIFHLTPHIKEITETNSTRITVISPIVSSFFKKYCGNGSHNKHIPEILWDVPKKYFLAFLKGYTDDDGYTTKEGKLSACSVSKQLITELSWLCSMHGIQAEVREIISPAGRIIGKGKKPLSETRAWNLIIGKTSHPFRRQNNSLYQFKKPIVEKIIEEKYDGYVYDFCGCENEAFFGGEKPILLHNSRVRDLFRMAKKTAPAIIFVDEIDAVGRMRGVGAGGGNDEREQTLNQILVEMDGFEPNEKVIVMAATNRPDVLDPALLRPGRFDRRVIIDLPDRRDREDILKIHARKKPLGEDVNFTTIAERTPGFSGADLYSLVNEAAILAARENRKKVSQFDFIRSIEKVMLGPERKSHILSKREKEITAYHEAGHALVASVLPYADPVHKISIISRGRAAGYTLKLPFEDRRMQSRKEFIDDIAVSLGGYLAEKMIFDDLTTGASNDLQVLTALARNMVTKYGMSEKIGPIALEEDSGRVMFGEGIAGKKHSEKVSAEIDAEVTRIIDCAHKSAEHILNTHKNALDAIAQKLVEVETIERDEFEKLLLVNGITPKKKQDIEHSE